MNLPPYPSIALQEELRAHIETMWKLLTRDHAHLIHAVRDPKISSGQQLKLYVSRKEDLAAVTERIRASLGDCMDMLEIRVLPSEVESISEHGLLYLPGPYVVPGGRFNEFYGWDSYFIQRGLLHMGWNALAQSMVDQALYEVEHYGSVLNANRTYYLSRSHPPVLSMMVAEHWKVSRDVEWLARALPLVESYYYYWRVPPHLNAATGLSRYHDLGQGPAPEVEHSERDAEDLSHYDRVLAFLRSAEPKSYDKSLYYDEATDALTPLAYVGDRSMRESGFDPTDRFGALNLDVIHYAPVCLNVLLHRMESDLAEFYKILGDHSSCETWSARARASASAVDEYFWDEEAGMYFDYRLRDDTRRSYPFLTTFWPLWAGIASPEQAARVVDNLHLFLCDGGLRTSTRVTGEQWDAPFVWAPLQLLAVDGLERYGYHAEAREVARRFTAMVACEFAKERVIREKYDGDSCSTDISEMIRFGYITNEIGFGWTNAVVIEFLDRFR